MATTALSAITESQFFGWYFANVTFFPLYPALIAHMYDETKVSCPWQPHERALTTDAVFRAEKDDIMAFFGLFTRKEDERGIDLYESALAQSRQPGFYVELEVPDTLDGRFDLIVLHMCLIRAALLRAGEEEGDGALLQAMDERFITDMDYALREVGVGDLSVGKQVKGMAGAYQGRWMRYRTAFDDNDQTALAEALVTNVYRDSPVDKGKAEALATYSQAQIARLAQNPGAIRSAKDLPWGDLTIEVPRDAA